MSYWTGAMEADERMKVAFVVQRYGFEVNGGSELHCRQVAEHMAKYWDMEVLTTCAIDYMTWQNEYPPGPTTVNGVAVQRFPVDVPRDVAAFNRLSASVLTGGGRDAELRWRQAQGPASSALSTTCNTTIRRMTYLSF